MALQLTSRGFEPEGMIPDKHSKSGGNISPQLAWRDAPEESKSFALVMDDPDAPSGLFAHWLIYGIPSNAVELQEDIPALATLSSGARQGRNGFGEIGYGGPQPPSGTHRYFFHLYALDDAPDLPPGISRDELDRAMAGHIIEEARLMGRYQRREPGTQAA